MHQVTSSKPPPIPSCILHSNSLYSLRSLGLRRRHAAPHPPPRRLPLPAPRPHPLPPLAPPPPRPRRRSLHPLRAGVRVGAPGPHEPHHRVGPEPHREARLGRRRLWRGRRAPAGLHRARARAHRRPPRPPPPPMAAARRVGARPHGRDADRVRVGGVCGGAEPRWGEAGGRGRVPHCGESAARRGGVGEGVAWRWSEVGAWRRDRRGVYTPRGEGSVQLRDAGQDTADTRPRPSPCPSL
jgi:hypothetical protein